LDKKLKEFKDEKKPALKTLAKKSAASILKTIKLAEKILNIYKSVLTKVKTSQKNGKEASKIAEELEDAIVEVKKIEEQENSTLPVIEEDKVLALFEQQQETQGKTPRPLIPRDTNGPKA
jgi:gas vesicle protein